MDDIKKPLRQGESYEEVLYEAARNGCENSERRLVKMQEEREKCLLDVRTNNDPVIREAFRRFNTKGKYGHDSGILDFIPPNDVEWIFFEAGYRAAMEKFQQNEV